MTPSKLFLKRKKLSKLTPLNLAKINSTRQIAAVNIPLAKPRSFEDMLESQGKENIKELHKNQIKLQLKVSREIMSMYRLECTKLLFQQRKICQTFFC